MGVLGVIGVKRVTTLEDIFRLQLDRPIARSGDLLFFGMKQPHDDVLGHHQFIIASMKKSDLQSVRWEVDYHRDWDNSPFIPLLRIQFAD